MRDILHENNDLKDEVLLLKSKLETAYCLLMLLGSLCLVLFTIVLKYLTIPEVIIQ